MNVNDAELAALLGRLSNAKAPSGFEDETLAVAREFCAGWAAVEENTLRDGLITPKNFTGEKPVLMLDAHGDEVGGMVKAVVSGKQELRGLTIDPKALEGGDVEMLQDLIMAAVNEAGRIARETLDREMSAISGGIRLPGVF